MSSENGNGNHHRNGNSPNGQLNSNGHQRNGHAPANGAAKNGTGNHNGNGQHGAESIPAHDLLWDSLPASVTDKLCPAPGRQPGLPAQGPGQPVGLPTWRAAPSSTKRTGYSGTAAGATRWSAT